MTRPIEEEMEDRITRIGRRRYTVLSGRSGQTYTVSYRDRDEDYGTGPILRLWDCTCPARDICRHIHAIDKFLAADGDREGDSIHGNPV